MSSSRPPNNQPWTPKPTKVKRAAEQSYRLGLQSSGAGTKVQYYYALYHNGTIMRTRIKAPYLGLKDRALHTAIAKFRIGSHDLMVEVGRSLGQARDERYCPFCQPSTEVLKHICYLIAPYIAHFDHLQLVYLRIFQPDRWRHLWHKRIKRR